MRKVFSKKSDSKNQNPQHAPHSHAGQQQLPPQAYPPPAGAYPVYHMPYGGYPGSIPYGGFPSPFEDGIDLRDLLQVMLRKWMLIASVILFSLLSSIFYLFMVTPVYEGVSLIELSLRRPRILSQQDAIIDDSGRLQSAEMLNTQLMKLQGNSMRHSVAEEISTELQKTGIAADDVDGYLRDNVGIELLRRSNLVKISARHPVPEIAAMIAAVYADNSVQNVFRLNRESSQNAVAWLESQIETQGKELSAIEERILEFRSANPSDTLDAQREAIKESLLAYNKELNRAVASREELLSRYTEKHPEVIAQNKQINAAREQYNAELSKLEKLEARIAETRTRLQALEREKSAVELSYRGILTRIEEARLSADENTATIKIVEEAQVPRYPVFPRTKLILLLALFAGVAAGGGLALLSNKLEDRIWDSNDVEHDVGLKMLGTIPRAEGMTARNELALASFHDKFSLIAESFSSIRGIIDYRTDMSVFLLTSTMPGEGKTICATNLAIMSAKSGKKTLLIDLDMRRPKQARIWKIADPKWNLLHALCDQQNQTFEHLPRPTEVDGLDVVASHVVQDVSPAEVLGSKRTRELLEWAADNYERVIIDTPPVGITSDAMVLGGLVDAVIMVGRFNKTRKSQANAAVQMLLNGGAHVMGMIINDVKYSKTTYGGYGISQKHYKSYGMT